MPENIIPEVEIIHFQLRPRNRLATSDISLYFIMHEMGLILRDGGEDLHDRRAVFANGFEEREVLRYACGGGGGRERRGGENAAEGGAVFNGLGAALALVCSGEGVRGEGSGMDEGGGGVRLTREHGMGGIADEDDAGAMPCREGVAGKEGPELDVFGFANEG